MDKTLVYTRNPQSGLLDVKEFAGGGSSADLLRVSDPILQNLVQGFTTEEFVGDRLMTPVYMPKQTGRFPAFGEEAFTLKGDLKRMAGAKIARLNTQSGYVVASIDQYALGVAIPQEDLNEWAGSPDMLINARVTAVTESIARQREYLQAVAMTTTTNYASGNYISGASKAWATTGKPVKDMDDAQQLIIKNTGRRANVAWFTPGAWSLFRNNADTLQRVVYGGNNGVPAMLTLQAAAALLEVDEVIVTYATYGYGSAPGSDGGVKKSPLTKAFLWESVQSNNAGLLIRGSGSGIEPAFGYTWVRQNSPIVESYYENQTKSMIYDQQHFFTPAVTLSKAGFIYYSLA